MSWKNIWVIGASTGIGRELALQLSHEAEHVAISARSEDKLTEIAKSNPSIISYPLDVSNQEAVSTALEKIETELGPLDLVIYNPGIWKPYKTIKHFSANDCIESMSINYLGAIHLLDGLLPKMISRKSGHIALTGSIAGFRGLNKLAAYGPTKAAMINLAETLRQDLVHHNIDITIINPGFVDTPMVEDVGFYRPFLVSAENAATRIIKGLRKKKYEIAFPFPVIRFFKRLRSLPNGLFFYISRRFMKWN